MSFVNFNKRYLSNKWVNYSFENLTCKHIGFFYIFFI